MFSLILAMNKLGGNIFMVACGCLVESGNCVLNTPMKISFIKIAFERLFDFLEKFFLIILNL